MNASLVCCPECGTELSPGALSCPSCGRLLHAEKLTELSAAARQAAASGDLHRAREIWLQALRLLPPATVQYRAIDQRLADLQQQIQAAEAAPKPQAPAPAQGPWFKRTIAGIGPALVLLLTKGKLVLLGLTKLPTIGTMLLAFGFYWSLYGWAFAAGLVISIYIHEMGHVVELRRFGISATAPMFIPGFGAIIWQKEAAKNVAQDARIGLAGPLWGLGAAMLSLAVFAYTRSPVWAAIAHVGAVINLFNLIPIWQLDGSHAFRALTRWQRGAVAIGAVALLFSTGAGFLPLVAIVAGFRAFMSDAPAEGDTPVLIRYLGIMAVLAIIGGIAELQKVTP